ncbi:DUF4942 domain-containing protein [Flagellimonas sp. CMM7]|uniref:DUF4942 domain-containing protein n=1 Tax=Flagellimonas sp. CMM7 TaxID=2654676 RepID=UPI0013D84977|nr:DUF4942 domain-containing protein [Flagellimonas sp. CMM7]UII80024.1 DUF4942 domain-containing protein [Flagellimonas sp. CMM7]
MFNKDFYPTPREVIERMVLGHDLKGKHILEPSAGKGNILDFLNEQGANTMCCEKEPELAKISASKARFLKDDFLNVQPEEVSHLDYIIMNPPFSADEKHIIHAWDIAPKGCTIISLCNWDTIGNSYSSYRRSLKHRIKESGQKENLGDVFSQSERKTGVEIGLITLYKVGSKHSFGDYFDMEEDEFQDGEGLMSYNAVRDVVERYVGSIKLYDDVLENAVKMNQLSGVLGVNSIAFACTQKDKPLIKEEFIKGLQKSSWKWVFHKMNMGKFMTKNLKEELNNFVETQQNVPFTMKNIYKMIDLVFQTHGQRMDRAIIEIFDKLTHHYHENRYNLEGWKTNSHYLVNKKFILNSTTEVGWNGEMKIRYNWGAEQLDDMIKAICYLTGEKYDQSLYVWSHKKPLEWGKWFDYMFFEIKGFKKGTVHCKFKDDKVWELFNRRVAEIKGYPLPEMV